MGIYKKINCTKLQGNVNTVVKWLHTKQAFAGFATLKSLQNTP